MAWRHMGASTEPNNFTWVIEDEVCALALPKKDSEIFYLLDNNVRCLISLTNKRVPSLGKFPDIKLKKFKVQDFQAPSLKQIDKILKTIKKFNKKGKAVAVQCLHGTGRTSTVLACLFVKRFKYDPGVAINKVQSMRPGSFDSQEQEDRVHEFWERETNAGWFIEVVDVSDDSESSEDEAWFIEDDIGVDIVEVYDDDPVVEIVHDDVVVYDDDVVEVVHDDVDVVVTHDNDVVEVVDNDLDDVIEDVVEEIVETFVESSESD